MILRYIIWMFVIYALFRLVFNFIIPMIRVSGEVKKKMREFQGNMQQQYNGAQEATPQSKNGNQKDGDYIDFEEVKS